MKEGEPLSTSIPLAKTFFPPGADLMVVLLGLFELRSYSEPYGETRRSTPGSAAQNCVEIV
jgi:hypothetical protein